MIQPDEASDAWDAELKHKERVFVLHYCTNESAKFNATECYRLTYSKFDKATGKEIVPEQSTCEANGSRLAKRPRVKAAIRKLCKLAQADLDEENIYKAIRDLCTLSFYNPADILTASGSLKVKDLADLGEKAKCIAQITKTQYGTKYTLVDRHKSLHELLNYLNIIRPEQQVEVQLPVIEMVQKAIDAESWNAAQEAREAQGE